MENRINLEALNAYAETLAEKIQVDFFSDHNHITGQDIVNLTGVPQINTFVLKQLFRAWNKEAEKLKSPYFDYQNEKIQQALTQFRNTLSHHIKIEKEAFLPLIAMAVEQTFDLVLHPYNYLKQYCLNYDELKVSVHQIKADTKYIKINRFLIDETLSQFNTEVSDEINLEDFINKFSDCYTKNHDRLETIESILEQLKTIHPFDPAKIFVRKVKPMTETPELPVLEEEAIASENESVDLEYQEEKNEEESNGEFEGLLEPEPVSENIEEDLAEEVTVVDQEASKISFNDKFAQEKVTLNDTLKRESPAVTGAVPTKVDKLVNAIGINQRYAFINQLFDGNKMEFDTAISSADTHDDYETASNFLIESYAQKYSWDQKESEVGELLGLLSRRF